MLKRDLEAQVLGLNGLLSQKRQAFGDIELRARASVLHLAGGQAEMCDTAIDSKLDGAPNWHPDQLLKHGPECDPRHRQLNLQVLRQEG